MGTEATSTRSGQSRATTPRAAARELAASLVGGDPALYVVFASPAFERRELAQALQAALDRSVPH